MILVYTLFSIVLSGIGFLLYYFGVKKQGSILQRKYFIYAIIAISLSLPFYLLETGSLFKTDQPHTGMEFHNEPIIDAKLLACYARASNQEGFCHCERIQQINIVKYESDVLYDSWVQLQTPVTWGFITISGFIFLVLIGKVSLLLRFIYKNPKTYRMINGKTYCILTTKDQPIAASFRLIRGYILWHPRLDLLSKVEQEAILQHEIAHIKNRDTWEQIGLLILQMFWFLNPIFYWIKQELELLNEYQADAYAVRQTGNVKSYAALLVKLKSQQKFLLTHSFGESPLKARILTLLQTKPPKRRFFLPVLLGVSLLMASFGFTTSTYVNEKCCNFEEYCHLKSKYETSGKDIFCRNCLYEDLN